MTVSMKQTIFKFLCILARFKGREVQKFSGGVGIESMSRFLSFLGIFCFLLATFLSLCTYGLGSLRTTLMVRFSHPLPRANNRALQKSINLFSIMSLAKVFCMKTLDRRVKQQSKKIILF